MAKMLKCNKCSQEFEVPAEHASAPALQCPFCAAIVQNPQEPEVPVAVAGEAAVKASLDPDQATDAGGNPIVEMAKRLSKSEGPNIIVDGLPTQKRQVDISEAAEEEEELTPEEDPVLPAPPYGYPGYAEEEEEEEEEDEPTSYDAYPEASGDAAYEVVELPEGTKLPGRGKFYFLLLVLLVLVLGDIFLIFAANANNGIVHFGKLDQTIAVMKGEADPMELKEEEVERPSTKDYEPVKTVEIEPDFKVAISRPVSFELEDGTVIMALYGHLTNDTGFSWTEVSFEGLIKTSSGVQQSISPRMSILSPIWADQFKGAEDIAQHMLTLSDFGAVDIWLSTMLAEGEKVRMPPRTPIPFMLIFTKDVPLEISTGHVFEVRNFEARLVN